MQCLNQSIVKRTPDIWTSDGWVELGHDRLCWEKNVAAKIFVSDRFTYPSGSQLWALKQCKVLDLENIYKSMIAFLCFFVLFLSFLCTPVHLSVQEKVLAELRQFLVQRWFVAVFLRLSITQARSLPLPSGQNLLVANSVPLQQGWALKSIIN